MNKLMNRLTLFILILLCAVGSFVLYRGESGHKEMKSGGMRAVTDGVQRTVQIPEHPKRVVALNASNVDLYYAAGGTIVGKPNTEALPPVILEAVKNIPAVGTTASPNVEEIIALQPDLVLGANTPFHHNLVPILAKAGIPILIQSLDHYQQILDTLRFYGEMTGYPEQAAAAVEKIENRLTQVVEKTKNRTAPKVLVIWGSTESFNMATPNSFVGDLLWRLGAVNVADGQDKISGQSQYVPLSMEYVARINPDVILLITHSSDEKVSDKFRKELAEHPAWRGMKAVREDRVHKLPYHLFAVNPGTRVGEAIEVLANLLYPEV